MQVRKARVFSLENNIIYYHKKEEFDEIKEHIDQVVIESSLELEDFLSWEDWFKKRGIPYAVEQDKRYKILWKEKVA